MGTASTPLTQPFGGTLAWNLLHDEVCFNGSAPLKIRSPPKSMGFCAALGSQATPGWAASSPYEGRQWRRESFEFCACYRRDVVGLPVALQEPRSELQDSLKHFNAVWARDYGDKLALGICRSIAGPQFAAAQKSFTARCRSPARRSNCSHPNGICSGAAKQRQRAAYVEGESKRLGIDRRDIPIARRWSGSQVSLLCRAAAEEAVLHILNAKRVPGLGGAPPSASRAGANFRRRRVITATISYSPAVHVRHHGRQLGSYSGSNHRRRDISSPRRPSSTCLSWPDRLKSGGVRSTLNLSRFSSSATSTPTTGSAASSKRCGGPSCRCAG